MRSIWGRDGGAISTLHGVVFDILFLDVKKAASLAGRRPFLWVWAWP
jgi:hypothetical protein